MPKTWLLTPTVVDFPSMPGCVSADLLYRCGKGHAEPLQSDKYAGELVLTPLELIDRIAQLVPPPRTHRHSSRARRLWCSSPA